MTENRLPRSVVLVAFEGVNGSVNVLPASSGGAGTAREDDT